MKCGIYKITNPEGKIYIGCSNDLDLREYHYKNLKIPNQRLMLESLLKYGWEQHIWDIIEYTKDLVDREKYYIEFYNTFENGLNLNRGGGGVSTHTKETKQKISERGKTNKGKRANSHWKGKKKGQEFSNKLSMALKGQPSHWKGKKRGEEFGQLLSQMKKRKPNPLNAKPILQLDLNFNLIKEHPSIKEAAKYVNGNPTAISNALKKGGNATSSSYIWRYKEKK